MESCSGERVHTTHSYRNSETIGLIVIEIDVVLLTNGKNSVHFAGKVMFLLENMVHCPNINLY